MVMIRME
jgi:hypothetical protein